MSKKSTDCLNKLEELKKWQEKQQKELFEKQFEQRKLLTDEQQQLYDESFRLINNSNSDISKNNNDNKSQSSEKTRTSLNFKQTHTKNKTEIENGVKKPFLKRGEGLTTRFRVHPDSFNLNHLPKYKYSKTVKQKLLQNKEKTSKTEKLQADVKIIDDIELNSKVNRKKEYKSPEEELGHKYQQHLTWANALDSSNLEPISIKSFKGYTNPQSGQTSRDDISLFEFLEKKVDNSSFCSNASSIIRLLGPKSQDKDMLKPQDPLIEQALLQKILQNLNLHPDAKELQEYFTNVGSDEETEQTECNDKLIEHKLLNEHSDSDDESVSSIEHHVRFSNNVVINEIDSDEMTLENTESSITTSTPNPKQSDVKDGSTDVGDSTIKFEEMNLNDTSLSSDNLANLIKNILSSKENEIFEKNELLKKRLKDLENEISIFQNQNSVLTKMKQEHELEKIETENLFRINKEKLDDEKMKFEIYLKEEKLKFKEEKMKLEKKYANPNKKEREEISKLRDQVGELQQEMKSKDSKYTSSQSRLRAQIRNLEKQLREKESEIESLKKENKKVESENIRLRRQNNTKMLNEINKNIAKLTPNLDETVSKKQGASIKESKLTGTTKSISKPSTSKRVCTLSSSDDNTSSDNCESDASDETSEMSNKKKSQYFNSTKKSSTLDTSKHSDKDQTNPSQEEIISETVKSLKREINNPDGSKDFWYPNGNIKKISPDGLYIKMLYYNKDIKETDINEGTVKYYYAETNTWHTSYLDGLEILEFPNGQTEHRYKTGKKELHFANGSIRTIDPNDMDFQEIWRYTDGTAIKIRRTGEKIILLPNGQKEIHTSEHKRREYPDGTVKIVFPDGSQETRYSNGRVRLKDKNGKLVMDSDMAIE